MGISTLPTSGIDLMVARREAGLTQLQIAAALGVSGQRISTIERQYRPSRGVIERYLAAVERIAQK